MKNIILTAACLTIFTYLHAQNPTDPRLKGLDTFATRMLKDWNAPGVSIAVVEKNKVVYAGGFGYRDYEKKLPVTENTLFAIGSCTKAFTASLLGILAKEGKLNIDHPVREYLPDLKFHNEYLNAHVTLRDMMCHRTGLPRHDLAWYGTTASRRELLERIQYLEPSAELREKYQYNNFMFMAQGVVAEEITGKSWETNIKERFFTPLGMTHSNMSVTDMEKSSDRSLAYTIENDKITAIPYRNIDAIGPAGSINSCAKDMANWLITWINNGRFNGKEIIPASYRNQAITAQMATGDGLPQRENSDIHGDGYGLGWGMSSYRGHYRVEHDGGIDGFITTTCFFPSDSIGIFVVSGQVIPTTMIRNFIADRMLKLSPRNWGHTQLLEKRRADSLAKKTPRTNMDSVNRKPGTRPSHEMSEYAGTYEHKGYGKATIYVEKDTLWIDYHEGSQKTDTYLQHYHYDIFRIRSTEETTDNPEAVKLNFTTDLNGKIESFSVDLEPSVKAIVYEKLPPSIKIAGNDLQKYSGEYELGGMVATVYIQGGNTLMVVVPGQPDYELVPTGKDEFDLKNLKGYSVKFHMNDKNEATAISFIQPNGTFRAEKKK